MQKLKGPRSPERCGDELLERKYFINDHPRVRNINNIRINIWLHLWWHLVGVDVRCPIFCFLCFCVFFFSRGCLCEAYFERIIKEIVLKFWKISEIKRLNWIELFVVLKRRKKLYSTEKLRPRADAPLAPREGSACKKQGCGFGLHMVHYVICDININGNRKCRSVSLTLKICWRWVLSTTHQSHAPCRSLKWSVFS